MPREILVDWTTASGGGKVSVFHFLEATPVADQRLALSVFLTALRSSLSSGTSYTVRTEGRELDSATGTLTGLWSHATPYTNVGTASATAVSDASQVLVRWLTDQIIGGRLLRGRTYIPGVSIATAGNGNPGAGVVTNFGAAATTLVGAAVQLAVWHRPVGGAGGQAWAADGASVWSEYAVLRRRRG